MTPGNSTQRHSVATRMMHWINAICVAVMLMSGLQIFNAHPRLYWGQYGANVDQTFMEIDSKDAERGDTVIGYLQVGRAQLKTTGLLGVSGKPRAERAFPAWATLPSWQDLAAGRRWHFFFAWVLLINSLAYLLISAVRGHINRDLLPRRSELLPRHIGRALWDHLRLRLPTGEAARQYNVLQKLAYLAVIFVLGPLMLATGLTMSPGTDAAAPWLLTLFGGRQSARTVHFLCAMLIVLFIVVHLAMVVLAGPWNELRSMITGRFVLPEKGVK